MEDLILQWGGLLGFAALITFLINMLKMFGIVKDDQAQNWAAGLNLLGLIGLYFLRIYAPATDLGALDSQVSQFVDVGVVVFGYIIQLLGSKAAHIAVRGVPLIGTSNSRGW